MKLFGVRVDEVGMEEALRLCLDRLGIAQGKPFFIVTPNPEQIVQAQEDEDFRRILNQADLAIPDGIGLRLAGVRTRVSGIEMVEVLISRANRVMLVGGRDGVAAKAARVLSIKYQGSLRLRSGQVSIKGIEGIRDVKKSSPALDRDLIRQINEFKPELLFVGFGAPEQEKWVVKYLGRLDVKVVMVVGGAIDQIADPSLRVPRVVGNLGLGWLYRLIREPWRWKRQLRLIKFGWMVVDKIFRMR